jgi:hypothetical protein
MAKYTPSPDCFDAANAASKQKLTRDEIDAAFQRVADFKQKLQAEGGLDGVADKLRSFAEREAERTRIAAAMSKRHAALNILVRDRLDQAITGFVSAGMSPKKAVLAVLEGTQKGVQGGRNSVGATNMAYEARYIGGLFSEIQRKRPDLVKAMRDQRLDADVMREMVELRDGGRPGITGNKDAQYLAKVFATYAELARTDLNKLGASVGKLEGWAGAQTHDDVKMIRAGKDAWVASVLPKLDTARTFPDAASGDEIVEILSGVYDTIITGFPNERTPGELGQRVNPANLAKRLGKSRVLHFRDAETALAYRNEFGQGNTVSGIIGHLRNSARVAANMEVLGPNPEVMLRSIIDGQKRRIKEDAKLSPSEKQKQIQQLDAEGIQHALGVATGLVSRPVGVTAAKIGSDIRAVQSMAKLGGALLSSVSDTVTAGIASQFRGSGFFKGFTQQISGMMQGRGKGEQAEIAYLIGEGFDGLIGHIVSPAAAVDGPVGHLSKLQETFFRFNGLSWWTDVQRATAGRMIAAEMGMRAKSAYTDLPANYRHVLGLHGITEAKWDVIRKAGAREIDGKSFVTPDRVRDLPDDAIIPLVQDRIDTANVSLETRKIASRMVDDREKEWIAKRKERLDGWLAESEKRLDSMLAGNQIRTEIDKQLAQRRIDLEKALIEEARTEIEVLGASREMDAADDVRFLLADARESRKDIDRLAERGQKVVERLGRQDFRGGQELGRKYQSARNRISGLRKQIAKLEREANKKEAGASQRLQDTFQSRLDELNEFMDRAYTREQARADALARDIAEQPNRIKSIIEDGRRDMELSLLRFFADETSYGVIEVDNRSRRTMTLGQRPGTFAGEGMRFIAQFKGFPMAFAQRVGGRAIFGQMDGPKSLSYWGHMGTILAGMTMAGYAAMTMKDIARGYWPPRDPSNPETIIAAFVQGGAVGIYGDFLFSRVNRFGGGIAETALGPGIGSVFDFIDLIAKARDAGLSADEEVRAADWLNYSLQNTPFINLFYTRPALDYLFINSMREAASPGYLKRTEKRRRTDYGQERAFPNEAVPGMLR